MAKKPKRIRAPKGRTPLELSLVDPLKDTHAKTSGGVRNIKGSMKPLRRILPIPDEFFE